MFIFILGNDTAMQSAPNWEQLAPSSEFVRLHITYYKTIVHIAALKQLNLKLVNTRPTGYSHHSLLL